MPRVPLCARPLQHARPERSAALNHILASHRRQSGLLVSNAG